MVNNFDYILKNLLVSVKATLPVSFNKAQVVIAPGSSFVSVKATLPVAFNLSAVPTAFLCYSLSKSHFASGFQSAILTILVIRFEVSVKATLPVAFNFLF